MRNLTEYIADDREFELMRKICAMTDEEFEEYLMTLLDEDEL